MKKYAEEVAREINALLPKGTTAEVVEVNKTNGKRVGVRVRCTDSDTCPVVYVDRYHERLVPASEAASDILKLIQEAGTLEFSKDSCDYKAEAIIPRLVNYDLNIHIAASCPHRRVMGDLLLYYTRKIPNNLLGDPETSYMITDILAGKWGKSEEDLYNAAMENLRYARCETRSITQVMREMLKDLPPEMRGLMLPPPNPVTDNMLVVTNKQRIYGAACILLPEVQKDIVDRLGDFVILPSSVNEVIAIPEGMNVEGIKEMIQIVNAEEVLPEQRLSNHPYVKRWNSSEIEPYEEVG